MANCDNCGKDSNLMMIIELKKVTLWRYCPKYECMEAAKIKTLSIKDQMADTHYGESGKGVIGEGGGN